MAEISFGFLLIPLQLLDLAGPMDLISNTSKEMVDLFDPLDLKAKAAKINFFFIGPTLEPVTLSGGFKAQPTTTLAECPKLDYLLIGGPVPEYAKELPTDFKNFIVARSDEVKTIFTTCTGALVLAATGLLDGREATVNHTLAPFGRQHWPAVKWNTQKNWVVDGKFWTAAGAIAGTDMLAHWIEQTFGADILDFSTMLLEYQPRDVDAKPLPYMNGRGEKIAVKL